LAPEPVWTTCKREKSLITDEIQIPDRPAHSLITIPTTLTRLPMVARI
jgi:hypothetical protein